MVRRQSVSAVHLVGLVIASANEALLSDPHTDLSGVLGGLRLHAHGRAWVEVDYWVGLYRAEYPVSDWLRHVALPALGPPQAGR